MATEPVSLRIGVFVLAENRLLRDALTKVLNKKNDIHVLAASSYSPEVVQQVAELGADVLLLDSAAFAFSDVQTIVLARKALPGLKVVMIGMEADRDTFLRSVRAGAAGYVLKEAPALEVTAAVRSVASDEAVCPPKLCLALFESIARHTSSVPQYYSKQKFGLTRREQQLVEMISRGFTNKEIAADLNLSDQTVKNHIHRILQKLGVGDRLSAVEVCRVHSLSA